jgi:hypothetical protein
VDAPHELLSQQIAAVEAERRAWLPSAQEASREQGRQLRPLKDLGSKGAWGLGMEFLGWRACKNRREVEGVAGA